MTEDKWDEDIWGIEHEDLESKNKSNIPKLIFYFAEEVCPLSQESWAFLTFTGSLDCESHQRTADSCQSERRGRRLEFQTLDDDRHQWYWTCILYQ